METFRELLIDFAHVCRDFSPSDIEGFFFLLFLFVKPVEISFATTHNKKLIKILLLFSLFPVEFHETRGL